MKKYSLKPKQILLRISITFLLTEFYNPLLWKTNLYLFLYINVTFCVCDCGAV